ncbi:MAG TPA: aminotransferase class IV [Desulfomicrobiaceae bacterium]|nr:aminotransferase class IV [Desulfomicrobiaceae bacterium]
MVKVASQYEYMERILALERPGEEDIFAFYEHRLGAIFTNPRLMLLPLDDHLVHRGEGIFESLKFVDGRIYQLDPHLERMQRGAKSLYLSAPCPWDTLREILMDVARASGHRDGLLSVFIGRGPGGFTTDFRECPVTSLYVVARRFRRRPETFWEKGVTAFKSSIPAKQKYLSRIKSVNYLPNVLMKREAIERGVDFPLCFDGHGFLAEGATENVVLVEQKGTLVVPEMGSALAGTTMLRGLELVQNEMEIVSRPVSGDEILEARELIAMGTSIDAVGVVRYNGKPIHDARPGPVAARLREVLIRDVQENGVPF